MLEDYPIYHFQQTVREECPINKFQQKCLLLSFFLQSISFFWISICSYASWLETDPDGDVLLLDIKNSIIFLKVFHVFLQLTILGLLPFYHSYGQMVIMLFSLMTGCKVVTLTHFEPELFLTAIQKYKVRKSFRLHVIFSVNTTSNNMSTLLKCKPLPISKENRFDSLNN